MAQLEPAEILRVSRAAVAAVGSDDLLAQRLVLKGGNALQLIHKIGFRASKDLDFSIDGDFDDPVAMGVRLNVALEQRLGAVGYRIVSFRFEPRPHGSEKERWGGYTAVASVVPSAAIESLRRSLSDKLTKKSALQKAGVASKKERRQSLRQSPRVLPTDDQLQQYLQQAATVVKIEMSKYEYCEGKLAEEIDGVRCFVYSPAMIAAEKLRAICQQMREYVPRKNPTPRARDFYDIHALGAYGLKVRVSEHRELVVAMFEAKEVPLGLIRQIPSYREFHRTSWPAVEQAVTGEKLQPFDFYFDYVVKEVDLLNSLGDMDSPNVGKTGVT